MYVVIEIEGPYRTPVKAVASLSEGEAYLRERFEPQMKTFYVEADEENDALDVLIFGSAGAVQFAIEKEKV